MFKIFLAYLIVAKVENMLNLGSSFEKWLRFLFGTLLKNSQSLSRANLKTCWPR